MSLLIPFPCPPCCELTPVFLCVAAFKSKACGNPAYDGVRTEG